MAKMLRSVFMSLATKPLAIFGRRGLVLLHLAALDIVLALGFAFPSREFPLAPNNLVLPRQVWVGIFLAACAVGIFGAFGIAGRHHRQYDPLAFAFASLALVMLSLSYIWAAHHLHDASLLYRSAIWGLLGMMNLVASGWPETPIIGTIPSTDKEGGGQ